MLFALSNSQKQFGELQARHIRTSGEISRNQSRFAAKVLEKRIPLIKAETAFNLQSQDLNLKRQLHIQARQRSRTIGAQLARQGKSGISVGSKSSLLVRNEVSEEISRAMIHTKLQAQNQRRSTLFNSLVQQLKLKDDAQVLRQSGRSAIVQAENRALESIFAANLRASGTRISATRSLLSE